MGQRTTLTLIDDDNGPGRVLSVQFARFASFFRVDVGIACEREPTCDV